MIFGFMVSEVALRPNPRSKWESYNNVKVNIKIIKFIT
jgi:hypothetical protein